MKTENSLSVNMMDSKIDELVSPVTKVLCWIVLAASVMLILTFSVGGIIMGGILMLVSLLFITTENRMVVDFDNMRYKEYTSTLGIKSGSWKKMFECKSITITSTTKTFSNNLAMGGAQTYSKSHSFNLNLKRDNYKKITIANGNYDAIMDKAQRVSDILGIEILDFSSAK